MFIKEIDIAVLNADQNGVLWYTKIVHYGVAKWCISLYQNGALWSVSISIENIGDTFSQSFPVLFQSVTPFIRALTILLLKQELVLIL